MTTVAEALGPFAEALPRLRRIAREAQGTWVGRNWPSMADMRRDGIGFGLTEDAAHERAIRRYLATFQPAVVADLLGLLDALPAAGEVHAPGTCIPVDVERLAVALYQAGISVPRARPSDEWYAADRGLAAPCEIVVGDDDWPGAHYCRTHKRSHGALTMSDPEALRLLDTGTPTPWGAEGQEAPGALVLIVGRGWAIPHVGRVVAPDADLIVYAVNNLRAHVERIAELEAEVERLRESIRILQDNWPKTVPAPMDSAALRPEPAPQEGG